MAGRLGNKGYSYFSEESFRNLQKAVDIMAKLEAVTKSNVKNTAEQVELTTRYKQQLADLGVTKKDTLKSLQQELEIENEIMKQREKETRLINEARAEEQKRAQERKTQAEYEKRANQERQRFETLLADNSNNYIEKQKVLNKLKERELREATDITKTEKEKAQIAEKYSKLYKRLLKEQRQDNTKQEIKEGVASTLFGTTKQDVQDIKDGVYWWKFGLKLFSKTVEVFSDAVKRGVESNYNSTENTLNRIVASNSAGGRFGWNRGGFNSSNIQGFAGGKSYSGFKQINNAITDQLKADNLYNNIANTEVMSAIADVTTKSGFGLEDAIAKGYQDTVIKYIVPYLDTTTEAFDDLEMIMPRNFKKCSCYECYCQRTIW